MSENARKINEDQNDIWVKAIKTNVGYIKKSLLDYADALERSGSLGKMKAKIHNDLSQLQLNLGILFETYKAGGSIKPFEDSFNRAATDRENKQHFYNKGNNDNNKAQRINSAGSK